MEKLIRRFSEISLIDVAEVGGQNSSLGEMFTQLSPKGINIPDGFVTTAFAFKHFLDSNQITEILQQLMEKLDKERAGDGQLTFRKTKVKKSNGLIH